MITLSVCVFLIKGVAKERISFSQPPAALMHTRVYHTPYHNSHSPIPFRNTHIMQTNTRPRYTKSCLLRGLNNTSELTRPLSHTLSTAPYFHLPPHRYSAPCPLRAATHPSLHPLRPHRSEAAAAAAAVLPSRGKRKSRAGKQPPRHN